MDLKTFLVFLLGILNYAANSEGISVGGKNGELTISSTSLTYEKSKEKCISENGEIAKLNSVFTVDSLVAQVVTKNLNLNNSLPWTETIWVAPDNCTSSSQTNNAATVLRIHVSSKGMENGNKTLQYSTSTSPGTQLEKHKYSCKREVPPQCSMKGNCSFAKSIRIESLGYVLCTCEEGYYVNNRSCEDIDECEGKEHNCNDKQTCSNTIGSFRCVDKRCDGTTIGSFTFPSTTDINSVQTSAPCGDGVTETATVKCIETITKGEAGNQFGYMYDNSTLSWLSCSISVEEVLSNFSFKPSNIENAAETVKDLQVVVSAHNLSSGNIQNISDFLTQFSTLAINSSSNITEEAFSGILKVVSRVSEELSNNSNDTEENNSEKQTNSRSAERIVQALETIVENIEYTGENKSFRSTNVYVQITGVNVSDEVTESSRFHVRPATTTYNDEPFTVDIPSSNIYGSISNEMNNEQSLKISFIAYLTDALFPTIESTSTILGIIINSNSTIANLDPPLKIIIQNQTTARGPQEDGREDAIATTVLLQEKRCVYWEFNTSSWSGKGCCLNMSADGSPECVCTHLTNFALLVTVHRVPADIILDIFSKFGCALTVVSLSLTVIIYLLYMRKMKPTPAHRMPSYHKQTQVHIFCNLIVGYVTFLVGLDSTIHNFTPCAIVAVVIHYTFLASFLWMAIYSIDLYVSIKKVLHVKPNNYLIKASVVAYGIPLLIIGLSIAITMGHFDKNLRFDQICSNSKIEIFRSKSYYLADNMCWLNTTVLYVSFLLIIGIVLVNNLTLMIIISKAALKETDIQSNKKKRTRKQQLVMVLSMSVTLGLAWFLGFFLLINPDPLFQKIVSWIFVLMTSVQSVLIFYFSCVRRRDIFNFWFGPVRMTFLGRDETSSSLPLELNAGTKITGTGKKYSSTQSESNPTI